jgi:hypothetical protein
MQKPSAYKITNRPLHRIVALKATDVGIERPGDLRDRELNWMLSEKERQDDSLIFGISHGAAGKIG